MPQQESFLSEVIIEHYKNPHNYGELSVFTHKGGYSNSYCGDEISVTAEIKDDQIVGIMFQGSGCSICIASMSLLGELIKGRSVNEIESLQENEVLSLTGTSPESKRAECALIGFHAIKSLKRVNPVS